MLIDCAILRFPILRVVNVECSYFPHVIGRNLESVPAGGASHTAVARRVGLLYSEGTIGVVIFNPFVASRWVSGYSEVNGVAWEQKIASACMLSAIEKERLEGSASDLADVVKMDNLRAFWDVRIEISKRGYKLLGGRCERAD